MSNVETSLYSICIILIGTQQPEYLSHLRLFPAFWTAIRTQTFGEKGYEFDRLSVAGEQHFKGLLTCMNVHKPKL